jgi:nucleotide-binding universal stress UspA family protein
VNPADSIVCGVDHSSGARAAARFAAGLADRLARRLVVVYVVQPPIPQSELGMAARTDDYVVIEGLRNAGESLLEEVAQELGPGRDVLTELRFGGASEALGSVAASARAELVVVGSRGLGSVGSLLLGSVSRRLAVHGPCPTVIVPESAATLGDAPIVCAVDDSEESRAALATAATLGERLGSTLVLAHVAHDDAPAVDGEELLARLVAESGLRPSPESILLRGAPAEAIVGAATARRAGMIVIGSRGRGALASAALGSVSSAVAAGAPCAVTIVRERYPGPADS